MKMSHRYRYVHVYIVYKYFGWIILTSDIENNAMEQMRMQDSPVTSQNKTHWHFRLELTWNKQVIDKIIMQTNNVKYCD